MIAGSYRLGDPSAMSASTPCVLIVDDDPDHMRIYSWLVQSAGFAPTTALVRPSGVQFDPRIQVDLVLLDYVMHCDRPTTEIARIIGLTWPGVPIVLLSDIHGMPAEMAPLVQCFVRKGDPERLVHTLTDLLGRPEDRTLTI
jgi:CheY-like chemotaxis protein